MRLHLELRAEELMNDGWPPEAAWAEPRRRFGDVASVRDRLANIDRQQERAVRRAEWWGELMQDLRFALRTLRRQPGFTAAAGLTLAFGIGATTAILSVVNGVLLRPLPYPNASRNVLTWSTGRPAIAGTANAGQRWSFSAANFVDLRDQNRTLEIVAAFRNWHYNLADEAGEAERIAGSRVSAGLFAALGAEPRLGRGFTSGRAA